MDQQRKPQANKREIAIVAVFLLGGDRAFVDIEDIAIKANELGPGLFTWRTRRDQVDKDLVRVFLSDAKKAQFGEQVRKGDRDDWMLTEAGVVFARDLASTLVPGSVRGRRMSDADKRHRSKERTRVLCTTAFAKASSGRPSAISPREAEELFRLTPYVVGERRAAKVEQLVNMFADDRELSGVIGTVATFLPERS